MIIRENSKIIFPKEPPKDIPKPVFVKGQKPEPPHKNSVWFSHDPAIYKDPVSGNYYVYNTGAVARKSKDLITWETIGRVVTDVPEESYEHVGTRDIWAPDMVKVNDEYRLYCSNSSWGVRQSCIFLAVSNSPEGPFEPRGCVLKTTEDMPVNAIDANIIEDKETGEQYMVYGSFWGGCYILKLDKETGLSSEDGIGKCLARRPDFADRAIEGPYIKYNPDTKYYYLFVSYGSLNSDYNIRVGRSKSVTGPYVDTNGREMTDISDYTNQVGLMIACGYHFDNSQGYMGPGHNSVLKDDDNEWYLVCHIREHNFQQGQPATMHIHKILWTPDGWPVLNPERYGGEKTQSVSGDDLVGKYERIKLVPMVPQGVLNSVPMELMDNGKFNMCSISGTWEMTDDTTVQFNYGNTSEVCKITPAWDYQKWEPTIAITGKDQYGICLWAKKI